MAATGLAVTNTALRLGLATFAHYLLFKNFFSPYYLHGYLWNMNQNITAIVSKPSVYALNMHHLRLMPLSANLVYCLLFVVIVSIFLRQKAEQLSTWKLLKMSSVFGLFVGLMEAHKIFVQKGVVITVFHVAFYAFISLFAVSLILLLRIGKSNRDDGNNNKNNSERLMCSK